MKIDPRELFASAVVSEGRVRWRVEASLPYFDGHFPGMPVLPAVAMLDATVVFAERLTGKAWRLRAVTQAKFARPVVPGDTVVVEISVGDDGRATARWLAAESTAGAPEKIADLTMELATEGPP